MSAGVDQDKPAIRLKRIDIAKLVPALGTVCESVEENQRWAIPFKAIMDFLAGVVGMWHRLFPPMPPPYMKYLGRSSVTERQPAGRLGL
jgi:hypothetical protein